VRRGIDLLKIESRPIKERPWQYNFYLDLQAPQNESELRGALEKSAHKPKKSATSDDIRPSKLPNNK
jgi:prephenate dehydratase